MFEDILQTTLSQVLTQLFLRVTQLVDNECRSMLTAEDQSGLRMKKIIGQHLGEQQKMKLNRKKFSMIVGAAMMTTSIFALANFGVASAAGNSVTAPTGQTIFIIPKDTINPYEVQADDGAATVIGNAGDTAVVDSGTTDGPTSQVPAIQAAIADHASAIIIAADDPDAICPSIAQAETQGITVVGFDSDFDCPNHIFINQAVTKTIGESEVTILAKEIPKATGQIAICPQPRRPRIRTVGSST